MNLFLGEMFLSFGQSLSRSLNRKGSYKKKCNESLGMLTVINHIGTYEESYGFDKFLVWFMTAVKADLSKGYLLSSAFSAVLNRAKNIPVLVGTTYRKPEYLKMRRTYAQ